MSGDPPDYAARAKAAIARGDLVAAYDSAVTGLAGGEDTEELRHLQVLALARMGDTERAMQLFSGHGLAASGDPHKRAVGARLLKDRALALPEGDARNAALDAAHAAYHAIYRESGDPFPGINSATLAMLSGRAAEARRLAEALLADEAVATAADFYMAVTRAEALLLLGRIPEAADQLRAEPVRSCKDHGARSPSWRQLRLIVDRLELGDVLLDPLRPPAVIHYAGHMFGADGEVEGRLRREIDHALEEEGVGFGYGALAAGADILFGETLLARGAEPHVVLPFAGEDFVAHSGMACGKAGLPR